MNKIFSRLIVIIISFCSYFPHTSAQQTISLAGKWQVCLDSLDKGEMEKWYLQDFPQLLNLPGTLDDAGLGYSSKMVPAINGEVLLQLNRKHSFIGSAWYRKVIEIPADWNTKNISMLLERVIWQTDLWIDGIYVGKQESLSTPHQFQNLEKWLAPGNHTITLRIDNRRKYDIDLRRDNSRGGRNLPHAYTNTTQIMWNGVIGRMELTAVDPVSVENVQVFFEPGNQRLRVTTVVRNNTDEIQKSELRLQVMNKEKVAGKMVLKQITIGILRDTIETYYENIAKLQHWDEFNPAVYQLNAYLETRINGKIIKNKLCVPFGMRQLNMQNSVLQINNRPLFLRGTLECNVFPLTGHPPMKADGWQKVFEAAHAYGLNHLRFHSWCPPEAAFQVADEMGFYLQIELPLWSHQAGKNKVLNTFLEDEAEKIIRNYGNHPSFCFWTMGNELEGDFSYLNKLVAKLKKHDTRHLYSTTSFSFQKEHGRWPEPEDEFYITQYTTKGWIRGQGIFNTYSPDFATDYTKAIDGVPVPVITHEMGQYSIYPKLDEIKKYTGVLDPLNFKAIQNDLKNKNLLDLAPSFTLSSGKFAANLYKEEIERILKTKGMSGFQLLDLHDFPGQGTALVGVLDAFWDSKGLVTPEEHRMYCGPVVPLIRFPKAVYVNSERFEASVEVANFGNAVLENIIPQWTVTNRDGKTLHQGILEKADIAIGNGIKIGNIAFDLKDIKEAAQLTIELQLKGTSYKNNWRVWVYPSQVEETNKNVVFTTSLTEALSNLKQGRNVLLNPDTTSVKGVKGIFTPVFWSPVHFPNQPGTMGIFCDPRHPALAHFPTEYYSDWQWWDLITSSKTMIIDSLPAINPIVRVIDNFVKNRKMANIIEARVGTGKLMLVSLDIAHQLNNRPAAKQLRYSLLRYMESKGFSPSAELSAEQLEYLIKKE